MLKSKKFSLGVILCTLMALCLSVGVMFATPATAFADNSVTISMPSTPGTFRPESTIAESDPIVIVNSGSSMLRATDGTITFTGGAITISTTSDAYLLKKIEFTGSGVNFEGIEGGTVWEAQDEVSSQTFTARGKFTLSSVTVTYKSKTFSITNECAEENKEDNGGYIDVYPLVAAGEEVRVEAFPNEGYELISLFYYENRSGDWTYFEDDKCFDMPGKNIHVDALFTAKTYTITNNTPLSSKEQNNGYIKINDEAATDEEVTVEVTPNDGYQLKSLKYNGGEKDNDITADKDGKYTFTMPAKAVTITAVFETAPITATFDFTTNLYGHKGVSSGSGTTYVNDGDIAVGEKFTEEPTQIEFTVNGSTQTRFWDASSKHELRLYKGATFVLSTAGDYKITKVEFTGSAVNLEANGTTVSDKVWEGNAAKFITFVNTTSTTSKINSIKVTYIAVDPSAEIPTITPDTEASVYWEPITVTLACETEGATIHYTLDGSDPTKESAVYSEPISISATTTVKAMAVKEGLDNSEVVSKTFTFGTDFDSLEELLEKQPAKEDIVYVEVTITDAVIDDFYVSSKGYTNGIYVTAANTTVEIYCYDVPETWEAGGKVSGTIKAEWSLYKGTAQLQKWEGGWDAFTYTAPASTYAITDGTAKDANGSITVAETAAEGETVTVTATSDSGYQLKSLKYNDGTDHEITEDATSGEFQFTMPAHDVTVTAVFGVAVYTIIGDSAMMGSDWDPADTANNMIDTGKGEYKLVKENVTLSAGDYEYKMVGGIERKLPAYGNQTLTIDDDGTYTITFTVDNIFTELNADCVESTTTTYAITNGMAEDANGSISFDKATATEGETVTITVKPASGYQLKSLTVAAATVMARPITPTPDEQDKTKYTFTMPAHDVKVIAEFEAAVPAYVAEIDCPTCHGDGLAQCSECFGRGCDACDGGNVPCTNCSQTGKISFTTLEDAISEVTYYGKITLLKDNSEEIEISKATVFVIDKATFAFDKSKITAGTGYDVSTRENGNETTFIITLQKTVAEILATVEDFPTSDDDFPANSWVNENGSKMMLWAGKLYAHNEKGGDYVSDDVTAITLTKDGNNYKYTDNDGVTVTFIMEGGALTSIKIENCVDGAINVTYTALHVHNFTYSANSNVITATCDNLDSKCTLPECKLTLTLIAPTSLTFDNNPKTFTFADGEADAWTNAGLELPTILYTKWNGVSYVAYTGTPTEVGNYFANLPVGGDGANAFAMFTITQAEVDKPNEDTTNFVYTGSPITYNVVENELYTVTGNVETDAGTYEVKIELNNKTNYKWADGDSEDLTFDFVIGKATGLITVDTTTITKTYGEAVILPTATSNFGTVTCDTLATDLVNVNSYTVTYTLEETSNYTGDTKTLTVVINRATVTKPNEDTTNFVDNGEAQTYTIEASDYYTVENNVQTNAGKYTVTVSLNDKENTAWADGTTDDLTFDFVINQKAEEVQVKDETGKEITDSKVMIVSGENGIEPGVVFVVEVINLEKAEDTKQTETLLVNGNKIAENEKIYGIYDAKLLLNGISVQPNGTITIKMFVPEELREKDFKLYHIHNGTEVFEIDNYTDAGEGYIKFDVDKLSQFAFVAEAPISAGAIVAIVLGSLVGLVIIVYVLGYFFLYRKGKLDDKKIKVIYKFLPKGNNNNK